MAAYFILLEMLVLKMLHHRVVMTLLMTLFLHPPNSFFPYINNFSIFFFLSFLHLLPVHHNHTPTWLPATPTIVVLLLKPATVEVMHLHAAPVEHLQEHLEEQRDDGWPRLLHTHPVQLIDTMKIFNVPLAETFSRRTIAALQRPIVSCEAFLAETISSEAYLT